MRGFTRMQREALAHVRRAEAAHAAAGPPFTVEFEKSPEGKPSVLGRVSDRALPDGVTHVVATISRTRKTKRSTWRYDVRLVNADYRYPRDPVMLHAYVDTLLRFVRGIVWPDEVEDTTDGR